MPTAHITGTRSAPTDGFPHIYTPWTLSSRRETGRSCHPDPVSESRRRAMCAHAPPLCVGGATFYGNPVENGCTSSRERTLRRFLWMSTPRLSASCSPWGQQSARSGSLSTDRPPAPRPSPSARAKTTILGGPQRPVRQRQAVALFSQGTKPTHIAAHHWGVFQTE